MLKPKFQLEFVPYILHTLFLHMSQIQLSLLYAQKLLNAF